jgi:hypothetical protein
MNLRYVNQSIDTIERMLDAWDSGLPPQGQTNRDKAEVIALSIDLCSTERGETDGGE